MGKTAEMLRLLEEGKGFLKTADAVTAGVSRSYICDFARKQGLIRVAHGLYMTGDAWDDDLFVLQFRYPEAVYSHETALYLLNLAWREPSRHTLTLRAGASTSRLAAEGVRAFKIRGDLFTHGLTERPSPSGHPVRVYNPERTVCDVIRNRRFFDTQVLHGALREYVRLNEKDIPLLMRYAKAFSVDKTVRGYMELLLQ